MARALGWIALPVAVLAFASVVIIAMYMGALLAGAPAPIMPWKW